jgi:hypothetical protein
MMRMRIVYVLCSLDGMVYYFYLYAAIFYEHTQNQKHAQNYKHAQNHKHAHNYKHAQWNEQYLSIVESVIIRVIFFIIIGQKLFHVLLVLGEETLQSKSSVIPSNVFSFFDVIVCPLVPFDG